MGSLFPCLPDEIGFECLLRVELSPHHKLNCVCKSWNAVLKSPHFLEERKRLEISEQHICMLKYGRWKTVEVYDLEKNLRRSPPLIPSRIRRISRCYFIKQKLVVFTDTFDCYARSCIWLYNFSRSYWQQGVTMPRSLVHFASAADEQAGLIYVAGGYDRFFNSVRSASVYNVEEDKWEDLPDMNTCMKKFIGVFADGKFYVMGKRTSPTFEVFDSSTRSWKTLDNRFNSAHFLNVFGRLYCFSEKRLIEYDYSQDKLHILGPLPIQDCNQSLNFPLIVGRKIFLNLRDSIKGLGFYLLAPPTETGGSFKLIHIETPSGFDDFANFSYCAAILDAASLDSCRLPYGNPG